METDTDTISSRISPTCPPETQRVLTAAWSHDLTAVKKLLDTPGRASVQDPTTGETPLHAAIRACGPAPEAEGGEEEEEGLADLEAAKKVVYELLLWGGIWNDVDDRNETPGCVARRLGRGELYNLCVEAGVRAEMLFGLMGGYEELESVDGEDEEEDEEGEGGVEVVDMDVENPEMVVVGEDGEEAPELVGGEVNGKGGSVETVPAEGEEGLEAEQEEEEEDVEEPRFKRPKEDTEADVNFEAYLRSKLTYTDGKLVDDDGNGVMMAWETDIMRRSVNALLPGKQPGKRILNIGFGMGIIDTMFAETQPAVHHVIEAHPGVWEHISSPGSKFGSAWEESAPKPGAFKIHKGKWQEVCQQLVLQGQTYDAIYFDTFGEDYSQLRMFFTELIPSLLDGQGRFGFFNGLGADRAICYDVYTKVAELHLTDAGLDVDWDVIDVDMSHLAEAGKGEWEGVKRRYWTLDKYRLPTCTFLG
ncbi:S-adenosyl-L-methionine-dependent methyltransferase [Dichotomopilus funicola]|uniref:Arginine N-methyltransferase 2 n=1 Tax=Dichotomopilus funicola TaxID=1934379 RepID=A0AAN6ZJ32_9PEZI|nr:S-adenosyl-L-methionine-dependent methyltransferase [Dichotomopilus funicola]